MAMLRGLAMLVTIAALPLAPAMAVVAIDAPTAHVARAAPASVPMAAATPKPGSSFHIAPGELLAAVAGLALLALTLTAGRQPHSVSA